tara:strand:+ start:1369 stop:1497 length:129 start_codon:yes stop_codon:yes gene_type:complete
MVSGIVIWAMFGWLHQAAAQNIDSKIADRRCQKKIELGFKLA